MSNKPLGSAALAVATAALLAACGGGGGGSTSAQADLQLSGVAATGLALAASEVSVKCASGSGTATTTDTGAYQVTVVDGALPCIIKVTGSVNGSPVTLHSVAEAGTTSGSTTTATANVTPLTEMILARAVGALPVDLFASFDAAAITTTALAQATTDVLVQLNTATGIDLRNVDPFKAPLVAATTASPSAGNDYDKLLDQLGTKISVAALPQVVNQIATTTVSNAPVTLAEVMTNANKGHLAGCPAALSGKYRVVMYLGAENTVDIDFAAMKMTDSDGSHTITAAAQACEFDIAAGTQPVKAVIGPSGMGAVRVTGGTEPEQIGYIFPAQAHTLASVVGKWDFLESGVDESNVGVHWVGEMTFGADNAVSVCEYNVAANDFQTCAPDDESASLSQHSDGFLLSWGTGSSHVYGFRSPDGSLALIGTSNPTGATNAGVLKTHFLLTRPQTATTQPVGAVSKFWEALQTYAASSATYGATMSASELKVIESTATTVTRERTSDGRIDTFKVNTPIAGMRYRAAGTSNLGTSLSAVYTRNIPGAGVGVLIDGQANHFAAITVQRP